jgi:hypothetical protein
VPRPYWIPLALIFGLVLWAFERLVFARSLGELVWRMKPKVQVFADRLSPQAFQAAHMPWSAARVPAAVTASLLLASVTGSFLTFLSHPAWLVAQDWRVDQSGDALSSDRFVITPFFYALGAWPRDFAGKTVFYALPYAKGPPDHFVGHVIARWDSPDVRVVFEGPTTPEALTRGIEPREMLYRCLTSYPILSPGTIGPIRCVKARAVTLDRHIREMRAIRPNHWELRWLTIKNPALLASDQVQGIYLSATNSKRGEDRFVMILPNGANQAITLDYPLNATGEQAKALFVESLRTLRASPDLAQGRRWVDERLGSFKLDDLKTITDPRALVERISEIQAILISKISVDPKTYDSYFHLAGTAGLLERYAIKERRDDWAAAAKPLIQAVYLYSKDLAPGDPRTQQVENLWLEAKKN